MFQTQLKWYYYEDISTWTCRQVYIGDLKLCTRSYGAAVKIFNLSEPHLCLIFASLWHHFKCLNSKCFEINYTAQLSSFTK